MQLYELYSECICAQTVCALAYREIDINAYMLLCRTNKQFWIIKLIDLFFCLAQLQEAFSKGLLKPGMNVLLNKPRKLVNSVVSLELITHVELKTFPWIYLFFFHSTQQQLRPSSV